ncbi:MAG: SUMF1/EgtB/PvdO family nonheme iron enzyme, partial [Minicystis sp.]
NGDRADRDNHPLNCIDWTQAATYCAWAGGRLPTEAEWEYAARGKDGRKYPWGNADPGPTLLNACGSECRALGAKVGAKWPVMYEGNDGWETTAEVGKFPLGASPFGLLDMAGNVWEWTADVEAPYEASAQVNPRIDKGPDMLRRVIRGGAWHNNDASRVRGAYRSGHDVASRYDIVGFRCARGSK